MLTSIACVSASIYPQVAQARADNFGFRNILVIEQDN